MSETTLPATTATDQMFFELDRFERTADDRLELSGRWFGVRGRRFVRPTLTLTSGQNELRALADLEHKPWAAEDGADWQAVFPCPADDLAEAQLAVAPDIAVMLPAPGSNGSSPRRLDVLPMRPARRAGGRRASRPPRATRAPERTVALPSDAPVPPRPSRQLRESRQELAAALAERDEIRGQLEAARRELEETLARAAKTAAATRSAEVSATPGAEASPEPAEPDSALDHLRAQLAAVEAERDEVRAALVRRSRVVQELRSALSARVDDQRGQMSALKQRDLDLTQRESALEQREAELRERKAAVRRRERELSASAPPSHTDPRPGPRFEPPLYARPEAPPHRRPVWLVWLQRATALMFLIAPIVVVAILTKLL